MLSSSKIKYDFEAIIWKFDGPGAWFFASVPNELSGEIRDAHKFQEEGWGRLKITAGIGTTTWPTAIWFDSKLGRYLLPVKADVRKKEKVGDGDSRLISLWI